MPVQQSLLLDSDLRNWVLLPITVVMVLVGMFRNNLMQLFESKPKLATLAAARQQNIMRRASALRLNYPVLPPASVAARACTSTGLVP